MAGAENQEQTIDYEYMVSVSCIAFNHEPYIRQALDSFLMQKTDFDYEILIHDDASTDRTADIIRSYEKRFPDKIKAVYQTENQYSQGISNISGAFNFPRAKGKYIAMCEGDDYWTDPLKLQRQVDYMENHPECTMCFHAACIESEDKALRARVIRPYNRSRICTAEEVIDKKANYPTASLMFTSSLGKQLPQYYHQCPVGDVPIHIFMASKGTVYYIDRIMSVYRQGVSVSWSAQMERGDYKKNLERHHKAMKTMFRAFSSETRHQYDQAVDSACLRMDFLTLLNTKQYQEVKKPQYRKYYKELERKTRLLLSLDLYCPWLYRILQRLYYRLRKA